MHTASSNRSEAACDAQNRMTALIRRLANLTGQVAGTPYGYQRSHHHHSGWALRNLRASLGGILR